MIYATREWDDQQQPSEKGTSLIMYGARAGGIGMDRQVVLLVVWHCSGAGGDNEGGVGWESRGDWGNCFGSVVFWRGGWVEGLVGSTGDVSLMG